MTTLRLRPAESEPFVASELSVWASAVAISAGSLALYLYLHSASMKVGVVVLGGALYALGAYLSGNARLFTLWALLMTVPFDLSKRLTASISKMGGESSFRLEMSDPFIAVLAFFLIADLWTGRRPTIRIPAIIWIWFAIMLMGVLDVVLGPWRLTAAHEVFRMGKVAVLFIVVCNELTRPKRLVHCAAGLTLAAILQSVAGLAQYATRKQFGLDLLGETGAGTLDQLAADSVSSEKVFRAGAFMNHPNVFGIFLAAVLAIAVGAMLLKIGRGYRALFLVGTVLGMSALITTMSRSGWLSFAVAFTLLLLLLILHPESRRQSVVGATGASAVLLVVCIVFSGPILTRVLESKSSAMLSRMEYIRTSTGMIGAKPLFGWGLNSYVYAAAPFTPDGARAALEEYKGTAAHPGNWLPPVHNIYLLWWAETGLVGLLLHMSVWMSVVWMGVRNLKIREPVLYIINAACLCGMVAFLVDGLFSFSLRINSILRLFWVLAAMITAIRYWRLKPTTSWR